MIFGFGKKKKEKNYQKGDNRSTHINGPVTNTPISSGEFHGPVTYDYSIKWYQILKPLEDLEILEKIKPKLKHNAASKVLEEILGDLFNTYKTISDTLYELTNLSFNNEENRLKAKKFLYDAKRGFLGNEIEAARARCDSITYSYDALLKPWFADLPDDDKKNLEKLFKVTFRDIDNDFKFGMYEVENFLTIAGEKLFEKVQEDNLPEATIMIKQIANNMYDPLNKLQSATMKLLRLRTEFERLSGDNNTNHVQEQTEKRQESKMDDAVLYKLEKLADLKQKRDIYRRRLSKDKNSVIR